jgi:hypothetical protein
MSNRIDKTMPWVTIALCSDLTTFPADSVPANALELKMMIIDKTHERKKKKLVRKNERQCDNGLLTSLLTKPHLITT